MASASVAMLRPQFLMPGPPQRAAGGRADGVDISFLQARTLVVNTTLRSGFRLLGSWLVVAHGPSTPALCSLSASSPTPGGSVAVPQQQRMPEIRCHDTLVVARSPHRHLHTTADTRRIQSSQRRNV